jgi:RNA polymerase sigma-70 factor (ECF subfamily)
MHHQDPSVPADTIMERAASPSGPSDDFVRELTAHQSRLRSLIRCLLFNRKDVEDVWQDTNVLLIRKAADFRPGSDFWAWSSAVAKYQVLTHCKKLSRNRVMFSTETLDSIAVEFDGVRGQADARLDARLDALQACLALLSLSQRQLIELRYGPKIPVSEIAKRVNRPVGSVRQALFRIRTALLSCVERRLAGQGTP